MCFILPPKKVFCKFIITPEQNSVKYRHINTGYMPVPGKTPVIQDLCYTNVTLAENLLQKNNKWVIMLA